MLRRPLPVSRRQATLLAPAGGAFGLLRVAAVLTSGRDRSGGGAEEEEPELTEAEHDGLIRLAHSMCQDLTQLLQPAGQARRLCAGWVVEHIADAVRMTPA